MTNFFDEAAHYRAMHLSSPKTRFWGSADGQRARFRAIMRLVPFSGNRIVDVGAGTGDLLQLAVELGQIPKEYTGVDIMPEFVEEARGRGLPGSFVCADVVAGWSPQKVDFVVACGIFGHKQPDDQWWPRFRKLTGDMWRWADRGIAFTLTSRHSTGANHEAQYCDATEILNDVQLRMSNFVALDHTYLPNDFSIAIYKGLR